MELSDTKTEIMDLISHFESLWTGVTHPNKYKDRICTLLFIIYNSNWIYEMMWLSTVEKLALIIPSAFSLYIWYYIRVLLWWSVVLSIKTARILKKTNYLF